MGYNYGARSRKRLLECLKYSIGICFLIMVIGFLLFEGAAGISFVPVSRKQPDAGNRHSGVAYYCGQLSAGIDRVYSADDVSGHGKWD